ncbi:Cryptochrome-1 [Orchesella cincta]|uniref:Cryptochrome-1 n=1 Tax=Orchesella cincta TaxID=48709 RepID=A0A1D2NHB5_ORCCI|nr:Cryptochrome-1 [Orchesella cincta]
MSDQISENLMYFNDGMQGNNNYGQGGHNVNMSAISGGGNSNSGMSRNYEGMQSQPQHHHHHHHHQQQQHHYQPQQMSSNIGYNTIQNNNDKHTVHWFRKGLRLHDNPSLRDGIRDSKTYRCIFVLDPWFAGSSNVGINKWRLLYFQITYINLNY